MTAQSPDSCSHYTIVRVKVREEPKDPLSLPRVCLNCGKSFGIYPLELKDDPKLEEYCKNAAEEMRKSIPDV